MTLLLSVLVHSVAILGLHATGVGFDFVTYLVAQLATFAALFLHMAWVDR